jgi:ATP-dependent DNA helicase Rep
MAKRCGGQVDDAAGLTMSTESKSLFEVIQTISLLSTLTAKEGDQNVVTLSTLHASKGLEWPHVMLAGVCEGLLPFRPEEADGTKPVEGKISDSLLARIQEERRLMYVGITRAQRTLSVSYPKRRKKGRDTVAGIPSRFIAEMALDQATVKENPMDRLAALKAEFAKKAAQSKADLAAQEKALVG